MKIEQISITKRIIINLDIFYLYFYLLWFNLSYTYHTPLTRNLICFYLDILKLYAYIDIFLLLWWNIRNCEKRNTAANNWSVMNQDSYMVCKTAKKLSKTNSTDTLLALKGAARNIDKINVWNENVLAWAYWDNTISVYLTIFNLVFQNPYVLAILD